MNKHRVKYQRILLKISGEIIGRDSQIFSPQTLEYICKQIISVHNLGVKIGVVIGGGNIVRGREVSWLNAVDADLCGMIATVINGMVLYSTLKKYHRKLMNCIKS